MEWLEYNPDWGDEGKEIELLCESGSIVRGRLEMEDFFPDGEGDEIPVWRVRSENGESSSIWDFEGWRFV